MQLRNQKMLLIFLSILIILSSAVFLVSCASKTEQPSKQITSSGLINPNSTPETVKVYEYIKSISGSKILSGQQESTWMGSPDYEMNYLLEKTGKLPAIRGLDYINRDFRGVNNRSIKWWNEGGLVSICWHWGTPPNGVGYESSKGKIDMTEALTRGSPLYEGMMKQMDEVAQYLLKLQEAGVPVLWRPFHEFDGAWFWWGKGGPEAFKKLWRLMYDRYTNYWGLNNLIWVLGYSHTLQSGWYPGDEYVDIVGSDTYDNTTNISGYEFLENIADPGKPRVFHENGRIPLPAELIRDGAKWVWFLTWHTGHLTGENNPQDVNDLHSVYNDDYVITLDELPSFK